MWAAHYIDDERVSREEFFRRTKPWERMILDRWQAGCGGPLLYASAEEWQADQTARLIDSGIPVEDARRTAAMEARMWAESEHGRSAGTAPTAITER